MSPFSFFILFAEALFTIAKAWKQPKRPTSDEWIKKIWYIYIHNGILLGRNKDKIMPFAATWMEFVTLILSELSQKEKDSRN